MNEPLPIEVQPQVRAYAQSVGAPGQRWLDALPRIVLEVCQAWMLTRGAPIAGGSRSYVCQVTTAEGQPAVLKVALPEAALTTQMSTLVAAQGRGYVQVLAHDPAQGALLLEALGAPVQASSIPDVLSLTARTLNLVWDLPLDLFPPLQHVDEHKAAQLFALVQTLGASHAGPGEEAVIQQALDHARTRLHASEPRRQVVVHGDAHAGNLLRVERARPGAETGVVFVDPEGFRCEPEYDLGVAVREWNAHLLASDDPQGELRAWCERLAQDTSTDAEAIWEWGFLERVSTGLYLRHHGLPALGAPFLATAQRLRSGNAEQR
ncbi:aminoglycoside phosphotransferase family protein [Deinococcus sonorensis]|uniref:Aminoglycoside phosphotransferase family protein n=2 Tax=Deinococcus sonorensis TaxID=309891 RepID=A0AAU7UCQ3_9DEIO